MGLVVEDCAAMRVTRSKKFRLEGVVVSRCLFWQEGREQVLPLAGSWSKQTMRRSEEDLGEALGLVGPVGSVGGRGEGDSRQIFCQMEGTR